ncbi:MULTISPECIES: helix-turn-helix domain-containing protein [unclassified Exiguobacterium]|uniref:helix-turn-helix domain-containing protein n=1 Tax=unclassified Exiguobacterium TaxID=2644629 RepID=UPI001BE945FC|nr:MULTISPECIES: helix-turn-helix domain-containing protein [unclassified Exiguobacterium]
MNNQHLFSVSHDKEMNFFTGEVESNVYLRVYTSMFTSGLVARMKIHNFATLMAIASYMDENGECYPTQQQLAKRMGVHANSVNKYVNQLLEFEVDGKPVITREVVNKGRGRVSSMYKIHPISQLSIFNGTVETIQNQNEDEEEKPEAPVKKKFTAKNVVALFTDKYRDHYGANYNPSWGRDMSLAKKLLDRYEPETVEEIIDIAITEYDERWKSVKFPRPTIGAVVSFIAEQAAAVIEERREQDKTFEEYDSKAEEMEAAVEDKLSKLDRM